MLFIGASMVSYGWDLMFDYEGLMIKKEKDRIEKEEKKQEKEEKLLDHLKGVIKNVSFSKDLCDGREYNQPRLVVCFNVQKNKLPVIGNTSFPKWVAMYELVLESGYIRKGDLKITTSVNTSLVDKKCGGTNNCEYGVSELVSTRSNNSAYRNKMRKINDEMAALKIKEVRILFYEYANYDNLLHTSIFTDF
tara:strand:+ start:500 stop:1075 length:576 start_codon:yes stop_codon:yes gene_type:complete